MNNYSVKRCLETASVVLLVMVFLTSCLPLPSYGLVKPMVCCSYNHSLALKEDGTVWAWGNNYYGQLGDDSTTNRSKPVQVKGLQNIKAIACMIGLSFALDVNGTLYGWGENAYAYHPMRLGCNSSYDADHAVKLNTPVSIDAITCSFNRFCGYKSHSTSVATYQGGCNAGEASVAPYNGSFRSIIPYTNGGWLGLDDEGQLWYKGESLTSSARITDLKEIVSIDGGPDFAAIKSDGSVWTWRDDTLGQRDGFYQGNRQTPQKVSGIDHVVQIKSTGGGALALKDDGNVFIWGEFNLWQDKNTDETYNFDLYTRRQKAGTFPPVYEEPEKTAYSTPTRIPELSNIKYIAAGPHYLAIKSDGTVWSWGYNDFGELGDGTNTNRAKPIMIKDFNLLSPTLKDPAPNINPKNK